MRVVGRLDARWNLRLGPFGRVEDVLLALDERPLEGLLRAVDVEALAVLAGRVVEEPPDVGRNVAAGDLDVAALDRELVTALLLDVLADRAGAEAAYVLGHAVDQA